MSLMQKLFGGKGKAPTPQEAIQRLRDIEEMLGKKSEHLEARVAEELHSAKQAGTKNKRVALAALKRKKRLEKQLQQIDGTLTTIEFQREALENASTNTEVLKVLDISAKALKSAHHNMDVDKVHEVMDDMAEQHDIANEIADAISQPVGFGQNVDDDELMAELDELEAEGISEGLLDVGRPEPELPSVPGDTIGTSKAKDKPAKQKVDADLEELMAWAAN